MKQFILKIAGLAAMVLLFQPFSYAQPEKEKDKEKKEIMDEQDEIIISRKSTKDSKITVEIKDGQVFVNGKPVDDFEDENISIRKRERRNWDFDNQIAIATAPRSPFSVEAFGPSGDIMGGVYDMKRAFLGVSSDKADEGGAIIKEITKGSAAEKTGLKKGDIIKKIDESVIDDPEDLVKVVRKYKPEDKIVITYKRAGKEEKATAVLGKYKMDFESYDGFSMPKEFNYELAAPNFKYKNYATPRIYSFNYRGPKIGIKAQDTDDGKGAKVLDIDDDSPAAKAGIKEGDIITQLDGKNITSANDLAEAARGAKTKSTFKVKLNRAGKSQELDVKIPKKLNTADL